MTAKKTIVAESLVLYRVDDVLTVCGHPAIDLFQMHCEYIESEFRSINGGDVPNFHEVEAQAYVEGLSGLNKRLEDEAQQRKHIIDIIKAREAEKMPIQQLEAPTKKKRGRPRKAAK